MEKRSFPVRRFLLAAFILICLLAGYATWRAWSARTSAARLIRTATEPMPPVEVDAETEAEIVKCCSDCHALPRAENFPRDQWHEEVTRGYKYYARSGRTDLELPPMAVTVSYFRSLAPEEVVLNEPEEAGSPLGTSFVEAKLSMPPDSGVLPGISYLGWISLDPGGPPLLLLSDMRYGYIAAADLRAAQPYPQILARLRNPARIEPCDLNGDKATDLVVAELGSSRPNDHDLGRVVWLRRQGDSLVFDEVVLASGFGRVCDVRPADLDGDGDTDLVVAEFGHYLTGGIIAMMNLSGPAPLPRFELKRLDNRPGTIHVPVHDFNADGHPDLVALVSQEYEAVDLLLGQGNGQFSRQTLWSGPDLAFGSSGLQLADMDLDGDMDILVTNGDAWDNTYVTRDHGVEWLENVGGLKFEYHRLADLPGAYRALAGDVDLDGDMDVVAVAWLPTQVMPASVRSGPLASILCLEQTEPGVFVRHTLEKGSPVYATCELADFDGDGDLDLAVGPGPYVVTMRDQTHWLSVWWNQKRSPAKGESSPK
ncbi:MAG: FG-GAP repeat domain-containing protein [Thermoguttaceae bacterium]